MASCLLFATYWILSNPIRDQPRYGYYCRQFIEFAQSYPVPGYADQFQFLGGAAAALGTFHLLNPPFLVTTLGSDCFTASETPFWRSDWRFSLQAISISFWWWWLLGRVFQRRGSPRVTLQHIAVVIPTLSLAAGVALYRIGWIHSPHGLTGFANALPVVSLVALVVGAIWAWHQGVRQLQLRLAVFSGLVILALVLWPPQILASRQQGHQPHYTFAGHSWILGRLEPEMGIHTKAWYEYESHVALNLIALEILTVGAVLVASLGWRPPNPRLHRTRPASLRSPLSRQPSGDSREI